MKRFVYGIHNDLDLQNCLFALRRDSGRDSSFLFCELEGNASGRQLFSKQEDGSHLDSRAGILVPSWKMQIPEFHHSFGMTFSMKRVQWGYKTLRTMTTEMLAAKCFSALTISTGRYLVWCLNGLRRWMGGSNPFLTLLEIVLFGFEGREATSLKYSASFSRFMRRSC